jgi:nitroimidazol reductase NimA-like FMN-containing flavoprotein (pyridoxamine 5'-phosphate oxidase superfamily)
MARKMTQPEREEFLAAPWIAVLSVAAEPGHAPLAVPVWYEYVPDIGITLLTPSRSRKARLLRAAGRASLCVQRTDPPRKYVYVEGPVSEVRDPAVDEDRRAMAHRYLGDEAGDAYVRSSADQTSKTAVFRLLPEHWLGEDQSSA